MRTAAGVENTDEMSMHSFFYPIASAARRR